MPPQALGAYGIQHSLLFLLLPPLPLLLILCPSDILLICWHPSTCSNTFLLAVLVFYYLLLELGPPFIPSWCPLLAYSLVVCCCPILILLPPETERISILEKLELDEQNVALLGQS